MAGQEASHEAVSQDERIKELTAENELLFECLHMVQDDIEKYYGKLKEYEQHKGAAANLTLLSSSYLDRLAENQKLRVLVAQQKLVLQVERQNSLSSLLGNTIIKGVSSFWAFLVMLGKMCSMWKALQSRTPPSKLGSKAFENVVDAYCAGSVDAVEKLLNSVSIAPNMRANAYTALARYLMSSDVQKAAEFARLAYEIDPYPYRLKWLAFRMQDAGDVLTAEAMLDILPADTPMGESEQRRALDIRRESKRLCIENIHNESASVNKK